VIYTLVSHVAFSAFYKGPALACVGRPLFDCKYTGQLMQTKAIRSAISIIAESSIAELPPPEASRPITKTLTRADLAKAIQDVVGVPRNEAASLVEMVLEEIFERIIAREEVKLSSFGTFTVRRKPERIGRNPQTGVDATISARLVVAFKPSNVLRGRVCGR
jgi:integration host factor subunit alpha